jgi:hypothetical protein
VVAIADRFDQAGDGVLKKHNLLAEKQAPASEVELTTDLGGRPRRPDCKRQGASATLSEQPLTATALAQQNSRI